MVAVFAVVLAPAAHAADTVTHEVLSDEIAEAANIEFVDLAGRQLIEAVPLPWQQSVEVGNALSAGNDGAQLRADWRPDKRRCLLYACEPAYKGVTVRISFNGRVLCESTIDVGNATCYGSVPHKWIPPAYI